MELAWNQERNIVINEERSFLGINNLYHTLKTVKRSIKH